MFVATHAVTINGNAHGEVKDAGVGAVEHILSGYLDRLDGSYRFSVNLWALPPGVPFDRVKLDRWPQVYLQAAGSRDRMTVEIRRAGAPGERHFVLGWCTFDETEYTERITWAEHSTLVRPGEVFTAAAAMPLFVSYWKTGDVPEGYTKRPLDL